MCYLVFRGTHFMMQVNIEIKVLNVCHCAFYIFAFCFCIFFFKAFKHI